MIDALNVDTFFLQYQFFHLSSWWQKYQFLSSANIFDCICLPLTISKNEISRFWRIDILASQAFLYIFLQDKVSNHVVIMKYCQTLC